MQTDVELPLLLVGSRTGFLLRKTEKTRLPLFVYDTLGFFFGFLSTCTIVFLWYYVQRRSETFFDVQRRSETRDRESKLKKKKKI